MNKQQPKTKKAKAPKFKNPAHYRLDFIKENTLMTLWSVHMTRTRVWLVSITVVAAMAALLWVIMAFTPLRTLIPGTLKGDLRAQYVETALRLDSLEQASRIANAYIENIKKVLEGPDAESAPEQTELLLTAADSMLAASEAERSFVRSYEDEERFNLSVLAPLAAEGMVFTAPVAAAASVQPSPGSKGVVITTGTSMPVSAVYRGTVIATSVDKDGMTSITIQHPNDFVSVYQGLGEVFVEKGSKVVAAQRIGHSTRKGRLLFELWHNGSLLDPREYIAM